MQPQMGALAGPARASAGARPAPGHGRERLAGPARPRGAAATGGFRPEPGPARRSATARAARSGMRLVLLAALVVGGAFGCRHALSPGDVGATRDCPTEYRPSCLGGDDHCVTDKNGCQVCTCVDAGTRARPIDRRDVQ
ncbi:hypothetical protein [Sorangium cellulosum]|nr:hypothetical protein [Sorangium cellulosum]